MSMVIWILKKLTKMCYYQLQLSLNMKFLKYETHPCPRYLEYI